MVGWLTGWWAYSRSRNQSATEHFICYLWFRLRFCTMNGQKMRIVLNGSKMVELAMKWWNESISRSRLHCANLIDILFMHECFVRFVYIFQIVITIESTNKSQKKLMNNFIMKRLKVNRALNCGVCVFLRVKNRKIITAVRCFIWKLWFTTETIFDGIFDEQQNNDCFKNGKVMK